VVDWFREYDDAGDWSEGPNGQSQIKPGGRVPDDPSCAMLDLTP